MRKNIISIAIFVSIFFVLTGTSAMAQKSFNAKNVKTVSLVTKGFPNNDEAFAWLSGTINQNWTVVDRRSNPDLTISMTASKPAKSNLREVNEEQLVVAQKARKRADQVRTGVGYVDFVGDLLRKVESRDVRRARQRLSRQAVRMTDTNARQKARMVETYKVYKLSLSVTIDWVDPKTKIPVKRFQNKQPIQFEVLERPTGRGREVDLVINDDGLTKFTNTGGIQLPKGTVLADGNLQAVYQLVAMEARRNQTLGAK